ncbi:hypothetical protein BJX70DRAFT_73493 [Aspergillus crustosus]
MDCFFQPDDYLQSSSRVYITLFIVVEWNRNPPSHPPGLCVSQQAEGTPNAAVLDSGQGSLSIPLFSLHTVVVSDPYILHLWKYPGRSWLLRRTNVALRLRHHRDSTSDRDSAVTELRLRRKESPTQPPAGECRTLWQS